MKQNLTLLIHKCQWKVNQHFHKGLLGKVIKISANQTTLFPQATYGEKKAVGAEEMLTETRNRSFF